MNDADRVEHTRRTLERCVRESGEWMSADGRVTEHVAGALLGLADGSLANKRIEGDAPPHYRLGGGGHRVTYNLYDLAVFIERKRVDC